MRILVDDEIVGGAATFAALGELRLFHGRALTPAQLADADVLLVRSVTRVDATLVAGSALRFVGTATAGTDHIDTAALSARGIAFADAPGCNAQAVAEHVAVCLWQHAQRRACRVQDLTVGIVGHGHVGRALSGLLARLGVRCLISDPPLAAAGLLPQSRPLAELLACDVLTLHVPLVETGPHVTRHLIDATAITTLPAGALLINAARGGVVDEVALCARLRDGPPLAAAIDCWAGEPRVEPNMLALARHTTPHIAGHTVEARLTATRMLYEALSAFHGGGPPCPLPSAAPAGRLVAAGRSVGALLEDIHPLAAHTARLQSLAALTPDERATGFDAQRKQHGLRRAFGAYEIASAGLAPDTVADLAALGFAGV